MASPLPKNLDLKRCLTDYPYYASKLLKIKDKDSQLVPLNLWEPQRKLQRVVDTLHKRNLPVRIIELKARQEGMSTDAEGRLFHAAHMNEHINARVIAHEEESGVEIFNICKLFYEELPVPLQPMLRHESKKVLNFENPNAKSRATDPGLRSRIQVLTAGKKSVARGMTIHRLHCSELGSWPFAEFVIPALMPTIPKTSNSLIIFESTAKGVGNFFHKEWIRAKDGLSNFYPFFLAWFDLDKYTREFNNLNDRVAFLDHLSDEEAELRRVYNLTPEQLLWRRLEIKDLGGDVEQFRQEYPANDTEAFLVSGSPIFDRRRLRDYRLQCKAPGFVGDLIGKRLQGNERGNLSIWAPPERGSTYVMGIDVSEGGTFNTAKGTMEGDFSCVEVWKALPFPFVAEQVAEYHGYTDPYALAEVTETLGTLYNDALASVEVNACGRATQLKLQQTYGNCYIQEQLDRLDSSFKPQVGWKTDLHSKKLLIAFATHCISDRKLIIRSSALIDECMSYIRNPEGTGQAASSGFDDRVMAMMIALFTLNQTYSGWDPEDYRFNSFKSPADSLNDRTSKPGDSHVNTDLNIENIIAMGEPDYEDHWMNY